MLSVRNLTYRVSSSFRLDDISFDLAPGEMVAILGPNGSGKSTLLHTLIGLSPPLAGSISWENTVLSKAGRVCVPPENRGMGILFQEGVLFPNLDVSGNIALGVPPRTPKAQRDLRIDAALKSMRIETLRNRAIATVSGGEQQRVALARALAQEPKVILLDEPFQTIDGMARREIIADVRDTIKTKNIAALLVTHDAAESAAFAERIILMRNGAVVQYGTMETLYHEPVDAQAAAFLGEVQTIDAEQARAYGIGLPERFRFTRAAFRPEDFILTPALDADAVCVITNVRGFGATREVTIRLPNGTDVFSRSVTDSGLKPGQTVRAHIVRVIPSACR